MPQSIVAVSTRIARYFGAAGIFIFIIDSFQSPNRGPTGSAMVSAFLPSYRLSLHVRSTNDDRDDDSYRASQFVLSRRRPCTTKIASTTSTDASCTLTSSTGWTKRTVRIRKTLESDLPLVAHFLSTAAAPETTTRQQEKQLSWKNRIDLLFAKSDIQSLLRRRWDAMREGERAAARTNRILASERQQHQVLVQETALLGSLRWDADEFFLQQQAQKQRLAYLWSTSDRLRQSIAAAAAETGEENIWRYHSMAITPDSSGWLQHLQLTAIKPSSNDRSRRTGNDSDDIVVGFCEIAMLEHPQIDLPHGTTTTVTTDGEYNSSKMRGVMFSPAIANLAVSPMARRQGIASQLLRTAERYVATHWREGSSNVNIAVATTTAAGFVSSPDPVTLGLYVHQSNADALALYGKCGYEIVMPVAGKNKKCDMWYMSKILVPRVLLSREATPELVQHGAIVGDQSAVA